MADNRRTATRILTEFSLTLFDEKGHPVDEHAVAHDVSDKGFKFESRAELKAGQAVRYKLAFLEGQDLSGRARIVWCQRTDLSYWGGAQFLNLSWGDRKRIRRVTSPSDADWDGLLNKAIIALSIMLATLLLWSAFKSLAWRAVLSRLAPELFAALLCLWALRVLLRWR
jgi:hypothetical protein